jgi:hypothetical protein
MTPAQRKIIDTWERVEADEPDISTEMLMRTVCVVLDCEPPEVCDALEAEAIENGPAPKPK